MDPVREKIAEWLRREMARLKWTPHKWASEAGTSATNITRALDPSKPQVMTFKIQELLAIAAGVPSALDFLAGSIGEARAEARRDPPPHPANDDETVDVRRVDLAYAMGPGTNVDDYIEEGVMKFDLNWLRGVTRSASDMLFVARGDGDSMSPTLINDDTVLIDTSQRILNLQDRIWAVSVYGAGMIKRLRAVGEGRVKVLSDNPTVPEQEVAAEDLHIVGRVVWVGRRI